MSVKGTTTDVEIANANKTLEGNGITTTNIVDKRSKTEYIDRDDIKSGSIKSKDTNKAPTFFELLLHYLFHPDEKWKPKEEDKDEKLKKAKLEKNHNAIRIDPNGVVKIDPNAEVQIISILENKHFTTAILDKKNKTLVLIDPNGNILNTKKFRGCNSKEDAFAKLFGRKKAKELMDQGYSLSDGNYYNPSQLPIDGREKDIFDNIAESTEQKNGKQSEKGACGPVCHMMVKNYLSQRNNPQNKDLQDILDATNIVSRSTSSTVASEYNAIKKGQITNAGRMGMLEREKLEEKRKKRGKKLQISMDQDITATSYNYQQKNQGNQMDYNF